MVDIGIRNTICSDIPGTTFAYGNLKYAAWLPSQLELFEALANVLLGWLGLGIYEFVDWGRTAIAVSLPLAK